MFNAENLKLYFYAQRVQLIDFFLWTLTDYERPKERATYSLKFCRSRPTNIKKGRKKRTKEKKKRGKSQPPVLMMHIFTEM